ncbi:unnamed protein product [Lampetra fluviatilis]
MAAKLGGAVVFGGLEAEYAGHTNEFPACCEMAAESSSTSDIAAPSFTSEIVGLISKRGEAAAWRSSAR